MLHKRLRYDLDITTKVLRWTSVRYRNYVMSISKLVLIMFNRVVDTLVKLVSFYHLSK